MIDLVINARFVEIIHINTVMSVVDAVVADAVDMTGRYVPYTLTVRRTVNLFVHIFKFIFIFSCGQWVIKTRYKSCARFYIYIYKVVWNGLIVNINVI